MFMPHDVDEICVMYIHYFQMSPIYFLMTNFDTCRIQGEVAPTGPGSNFISLVIVMFGSLCWVVPLFTVARKTGRDCGWDGSGEGG